MTISAVDMIEQEHAEIGRLFEQVGDPEADRRSVLADLQRRLAAHVSIEQSLLFSVVKDHQIGGEGLPDALQEQYDGIQRLLVLSERRKTNSPDMPDLVTDLLDLFDRHRREWTAVVTPGLRREVHPDELARLGEEIRSAEHAISSHPHPHMLSLGPISRFTTRLAAVFDRMRDRTVSNK